MILRLKVCEKLENQRKIVDQQNFPLSMSIQVDLNKRYFPSYGQIQHKILKEQKKKQDQKVDDLQRKICALTQTFNLREEHEQIKTKLLQNYQSTNHELLKSMMDSVNADEERLNKQKDSTQWNMTSSGSNAYSLNYCIDEDMEEDNHYQNHLKFKKQVLENDLFENTHFKHDKRKHCDQEYIFKNLYNSRPSSVLNSTSPNLLKQKKPIKNNYFLSENQKLKKNHSNYLIKNNQAVQRPINAKTKHFKPVQNNSVLKRYARKLPREDQFLQQHQVCQKNTKILKDNYGKYLKELEGTHIVKWRISTREKENQKQKEPISQSISSNFTGKQSKFY